VPAGNLTTALDGSGSQITLRFPGYPNGVLPDGNYTVTLAAGAVAGTTGLPLAAISVTPFFVLAGDANRDRTVGAGDFNLLATHFGQAGQNWTTGDFNGDGVVGAGDFNLLASRFGTTLASPASVVLSNAAGSPEVTTKAAKAPQTTLNRPGARSVARRLTRRP
jgi:hypothetical protein